MYQKNRAAIFMVVVVFVFAVALSAHAHKRIDSDDAHAPVDTAKAFVEGELIVKVKPGGSLQDAAQSVDADVLRPIGDGSMHILKLRFGSVQDAVRTCGGRTDVSFVEPNWMRQPHLLPNDGGYGLKWDLHNVGDLYDGSDRATADADMDWYEAYEFLGSTFNGSAVIAVIDSGIDLGHPDLVNKVNRYVPGHDFIDNDDQPWDEYGHGTHVAGIALAEPNNQTGDDTCGVAYSPNITVMPIRVCNDGCPASAVVEGIYYAVDNGADVINLSLGGGYSSAEEEAIRYAWNKGVVVVASSGNDGLGQVSYPAAFPQAIAVGSTDWHDAPAPYSNYGSGLDVVAPGGRMARPHDPRGIYSCMPTYPVTMTTQHGNNMGYDQLQGTSMAAPQVTGLVALLFAVGVADLDGDGRINTEIRALIENTCDDLGAPGWDAKYGWGRINVFKAVQAAVQPPYRP